MEPRTLTHRSVVEFYPKAPFNFDASLHKPDHFPSADTAWEPGVRWQTMLWDGWPLGLKFENQGTPDLPRVSLSIWSAEPVDPGFIASLKSEIDYRYTFSMDLTGFNRKYAQDPQLGPIIERWRGLRPANYCSLYEYLIIAIMLQNATVRRSVNMMQALFENFGTLLSYDDKMLYCFWEPKTLDRVSEERLRALKIGYRAKSIKRVTSSFVERHIDEFTLRKETKETQREALLGLYGIGPASVGYILFDVFHHMDELNYISPWEGRIYSRLFFDADPSDPVPVGDLLAHLDERYGEDRMLAVHYIWQDLFWKRKTEQIAWLEELIRL